MLADMHLRDHRNERDRSDERPASSVSPGGIGSGKSTVAAMLGALGAFVVDCDGLGRQVIEPERPRVCARRRTIRAATSSATMGRSIAARWRRSCSATRASWRRSMPSRIRRSTRRSPIASPTRPTDQIVVLDMAVLVETDLGAGQYDTVVVVEAPLDVRLARLAQRGMTEDDARARIASQATDDQRREVADFVIDNGGDIDDLREEVTTLWDALTR